METIEFEKWNIKEIEDKYSTEGDVALRSGGWTYRKLDLSGENEAGKDAGGADSRCEQRNRSVVIFKASVATFGTYRVTVRISAGADNLNGLTLFAGRRNLIDRNISIAAGEVYEKNFCQAVMPYIPALSSEICEEKSLFVSIAGLEERCEDTEVCIRIEAVKEDVPVIWIAGDSTLTDQNAGIPYYPYGSCAGWAQILPRYIKNAAVCNLAHSGMTTNCFRADGHLDIALEYMKKGDFFIMQFGHNDQKRRNLSAYEGYTENLRNYIREVRDKGVTPILCSPISRVPLVMTDNEAEQLRFTKGKNKDKKVYYSLLSDYADACRRVAQRMDVCFANLHEKTFEKWVELGDAAREFFMPGDITHTNEYGATLIADYFMDEIRSKKVSDGTQAYFAATMLQTFDNQLRPSFYSTDSDTKVLPKELPGKDIFAAIEPPYIDIQDIPEYEGIKKAFRYGLLDPCVMYLHPYDFMPRAQLLMVMFKAFRMNGVRPYKNKFFDIKLDEWDSGYVQALIEAGLIDYSTCKTDATGKLFFRPDEYLTYGELVDFIRRKLLSDHQSVYGSLQEYAKGSSKDVPVTRANLYSILAEYMDYVGNIDSDLPSDSEVHPVH